MTRYVLQEVPVNNLATGVRRERDAFGSIDVPADRYWGSGTQRALRSLPLSAEHLPERFFNCYGYVKRAAAVINAQAGRLPTWKAAAIIRAADDLIAGLLRDHFPLPLYQTGSGQDADTNVNEVLANRAAQLLGSKLGKRHPIDPGGDVNHAQSLGATFDASMQIAAILEIEEALAPSCSALARTFDQTPDLRAFDVGRLRASLVRLDEAEGSLHELGSVLGETDAPTVMTMEEWHVLVGALAADTKRPFIGVEGSVAGDAMVAVMAATRGVAIVLHDAANAVRAALGSSRPVRTVGPIDALSIVCLNVIALDQVVAACCRDNLLHSTRPLTAAAVLRAIVDLGQACDALRPLVTRLR